MTLIYSPVPMKKLLWLSPRNYPELFDKYDNLDLEEYHHTSKGQEFIKLCPFRMYLPGKFHKKKDVIDDIFWNIMYLSLTFNEDYYIYLVNDNYYYDIFGHFGHGNTNKTIQGSGHPQEVKEKWGIVKENYNLNQDIEQFVNLCNMKRKTFYEYKIKGILGELVRIGKF